MDYWNITDDVLGTPVLGNDSIIYAQLITPDGGLFDLATGLLNNTTGSYNISITAPTVVPSGVYDIEILTDFAHSLQPMVHTTLGLTHQYHLLNHQYLPQHGVLSQK